MQRTEVFKPPRRQTNTHTHTTFLDSSLGAAPLTCWGFAMTHRHTHAHETVECNDNKSWHNRDIETHTRSNSLRLLFSLWWSGHVLVSTKFVRFGSSTHTRSQPNTRDGKPHRSIGKCRSLLCHFHISTTKKTTHTETRTKWACKHGGHTGPPHRRKMDEFFWYQAHNNTHRRTFVLFTQKTH